MNGAARIRRPGAGCHGLVRSLNPLAFTCGSTGHEIEESAVAQAEPLQVWRIIS